MSEHFFNRYFFIDYENVGILGLKGLESLTDADSVSIFYSEYAQSLTFEYHNKINDSKADIDLIKVETPGENALDFQLSSYLGFIISENQNYFPDETFNYYIISKDKGYKPLISFWKNKAAIEQYIDLTLTISADDYSARAGDTNLLKKITSERGIIIPNGCLIKGDDIEFILNTVEGNVKLTQEILKLSAGGGLKTDLNALITKTYPHDTKKAGGLYQLIKHLFP